MVFGSGSGLRSRNRAERAGSGGFLDLGPEPDPNTTLLTMHYVSLYNYLLKWSSKSAYSLNEFHHVTTQSEPTILYFWARWCSPCKSLAPKIKEFANQNQNVRFFKVDVEEQRSIANEALVAFVPTVIIYQQGEIVKKLQAPEPALLGDVIQML